MSRLLPALVAAAIFSVPLSAQNGSAGKVISTMSGVYSREQSRRGEDVYVGMCKSCHIAESHTAATFTSKWSGKPLSELYLYIRDQMPKNAPGSLSEEEYTDVLAYLLRLNRMPAGAEDLPADEDRMKGIRFETRKNPVVSTPAAVRKDP